MEKHFDYRFKKKFGQNFLIDENIIRKIVLSASILDNSLVIEIGPGSAALTTHLCEKAKHVICYEIDTELKPILDKTLNDYKNVEVIYEDFLKQDVADKIKGYSYDNLYVVANLPYYITTPIINKIIDDKIDVRKIVIMVQKEVGERFSAVPGSKSYGSISVFLKYYFDIKKVMDVSRNVFVPKPNVDSVVIELNRNRASCKNEDVLFKLIKDAFRFKRKTIKNNLSNYDLVIIESVLKKHNMDLSIRAEEVSLEVFIDIAQNLEK